MPKQWSNVAGFGGRSYTCPYCGNLVASTQGFGADDGGQIRLCPHCAEPTYFDGDRQVPGTSFGGDVESVPEDVAAIYREARDCISASAHTAAVMLCRKLLMHLGVEKGAKPGQSYIDYVEYFADKGYVPPEGTGWVDHIRRKGNEANHELVLMSRRDAEELVSFLEMLLKFMYEFPAKIPPAP